MSKIVNIIKQYWSTVLIVALLILTYYYLSITKIFSATLFPPVYKIAEVFMTDYPTMLSNIGTSLTLVIPSLAITLVIAVLLGAAMGINTFLRDSLHPIIYALSCIPSILLTPFLILLCPNLRTAAIIIIIYGIVWSTLFATMTGMEGISVGYIETARTLNIKGFKLIMDVLLPASAPAIIGGFIISLRASFVMLVFAEMYGINSGLGYYVRNGASMGRYDQMWAGLIVMVLFVLVVMQLFQRVKDYALRWTE